jgi:hypothetical protein
MNIAFGETTLKKESEKYILLTRLIFEAETASE